jgi:hypothetical protein
MLLEPEAAPQVTDSACTVTEIVDAGVRIPRHTKPARPLNFAVVTMATVSFVSAIQPTLARAATAVALDRETDVDGDLGDELETSDFVPLQRSAPRWSIAVDPRMPLVSSREPFIPPSMLELDDDERTGPNADV